MFITLAVIILLIVAVALFVRRPIFGRVPSGERLERMKRSPHYKDGKFHNVHFTPTFAEGYNVWKVLYRQLFRKPPHRRPVDTIPSVKTDLLHLQKDADMLVWFGHSSYFMQLDGKTMLVDPVFSGNASPLPNTNTSFKGTDIYTAADLPYIDYLFITHDHYDHLDYETIIQLNGKVGKIICGLGVGAHFERWGFPADIIIEMDWYDERVVDEFKVYTAPTRHFSGRVFVRNNTLWLSFILQTQTMKIYMGGDSGYDTHFAEIGEKHGPIDIAILDNGQYDPAWRYIHSMPEDALKAAKDLKTKRLFPVHSCKFMLANHPWYEPLVNISLLNKDYHFPLLTPMIGEPVYLKDTSQQFSQWWVGVK